MTTSAAIKAGLRRYIKDITFAKPAKKNKDPDRKIVGTPSKVTQETTIKKGGVDKIKFTVPASSMADIYIGDQGVKFSGDVSVSLPSDGSSCTLFVG